MSKRDGVNVDFPIFLMAIRVLYRYSTYSNEYLMRLFVTCRSDVQLQTNRLFLRVDDNLNGVPLRTGPTRLHHFKLSRITVFNE